MNSMESIARAALEAGSTVDLKGCVYGPPHWDGPAMLEPPPYYGLLAGLVKTRGVRRILELGTHAGGATLSMARALPEAPDAMLVTADVTSIPNPELDAHPRVTRIQGDAFAPETMTRIKRLLGDQPIDLLFIDIVHGYHQTKRAIGLYANRFQPALIALDDVALGTGMRMVWDEMVQKYPAIEVGAIMNRPEIGFGLVMPPRPMRLDEGDPWRASLWAMRRAVSARLSYRTKARIFRVLERLSPGLHRRLDPS
jgi:hypothetical protein